MKRHLAAAAALVVLAIGISILGGRHIAAQQQRACQHGDDEAPEHRTRRQNALGLARHVNTLQAAAFGRTRTFQPLATLAVTQRVEGFTVHLVTDGTTYGFSVKDSLDPCRFAYFSDEDGIIFEGQPIR